MADFNWFSALLGGILIGLSSTLLLLFNGRFAGISGMVHSLVTPGPYSTRAWRWLFLAGLLGGTALYSYILTGTPTPTSRISPIAILIGGFLVGFGTRQGDGCTSGHGVCGLGRLSPRSLVAVITFLATAMVTVFVVKQVSF